MIRIVPQTAMVDGVEVEVNCKPSRYFLGKDQKTGEPKWFPLAYPSYVVCIQRANWKGDAVVKVKYYPHNGRFRVVFSVTDEEVPTTSKTWEPGKTRPVYTQTDYLTTDGAEKELARLCGSVEMTDEGPKRVIDREFIEEVLTLLLTTAEE